MRFPKWLAAAGILAAVVIYLRSQRDVMEELSTIAPEKISAFIERNPDLPHGYYVRARNVSWREAEPDLQRALRLDPKFGPAWTLLGRVRIEQYQDRLWGDPETFRRNMKAAEPILREAQAAFEKGGFDDVLGQAMFTYYIEGDKERGKRLLESAPPSPEVYHWRGVMGGPKENIEWQTRALRLDPAYLPAIYSRGLARVVSGDCRGGIEDLSMSIQASPRNPHAWFYRGIARNRLNDAAGALEDCRRAVELLPEYGQAWALSAQIKLARKDYEGALSDALRSSLLDAFLVRAQAHMFRGRLAEAERVYDEIIERWPRTGPAYASRGLCAFTLNRPVDADRDFERALELMGEGDPNRALVSQWRTRVRRHFEY